MTAVKGAAPAAPKPVHISGVLERYLAELRERAT